jgi:CDP-glucose 4,6-dehydratase
MADNRIDIRDANALTKCVIEANPEIVFHMAAQPLVRRSYRDPVETWQTNVMGTVNLLEACRRVEGLRAIVIVTTDKCYENIETPRAYQESDKLGGHDPYSASKAATELAAASYRRSFFHAKGTLLATARAGNVIGGGDWSEDRLIPDLVRAQHADTPLIIRSPNATRPWQHVLEPLSGYLQLGQALYEGNEKFAEAWNFGPDSSAAYSVQSLLEQLRVYWPELSWHVESAGPHEAAMLQLNSDKARQHLGWSPVLPFQRQLEMTADWYRAYYEKNEVRSMDHLQTYITAAAAMKAAWC